jgi:hypothetical protein
MVRTSDGSVHRSMSSDSSFARSVMGCDYDWVTRASQRVSGFGVVVRVFRESFEWERGW